MLHVRFKNDYSDDGWEAAVVNPEGEDRWGPRDGIDDSAKWIWTSNPGKSWPETNADSPIYCRWTSKPHTSIYIVIVNFWWLCSEEHKNSVHSGIRVYY